MQLSVRATARKLLLATVATAFLALASTPSQAQDDPPAQAGRISFVSGAVSIQQVGIDDWGQAAVNLPLGPGDRIFTDADGRAEIQVGQTFLRLGPNSDVSFDDSTAYSLSFGVAQGSVRIHCHGLWQGQWLHVNTPSGSAGLSKPGVLRVDVLPDQGAAIFTGFFGNALISGAGGFAQEIGAQQALELVGSNPVIPQWLQPATWDGLDQWSHDRDVQVTNAAAYRYVSPEIPGADELDANGTWLPGTEYGAIWFPNNVPIDWAPYHYGHWVNHAPWGWVWVEDESWGYAPFHYGRWVSFSGRWGWVPGPPAAHPVWSPALVVFAGGIHAGGAGVSAWFPLGPGEPYRPWYHASPRYIDQVNISNIGESRRVHVAPTYVNFNFGGAVFANHAIGVSAMSHDDFAAGHSARRAAVVVDIHLFDHVQVLERPEEHPGPHPFAGHPPARPVPVRAERPVLINENGKLAPSKPGAVAIEPPVKAVPQVKTLPGRAVVAPPPGAKMPPARTPPLAATPAGKPAPAAAPPLKPADKPADKGVRPTAPVAPPAATPAKPVAPPTATPTKPAERPAVEPAAKPGVQPIPPAGTKPPARTPPAVATPPAKPVPAAAPPLKPADKPADKGVRPPAPVAAPPAKPASPPAATVAKPAERPVVEPVAKPATPPPAKPAAQPAPKPAPPAAAKPPEKKADDKKADKDKKKDEKKP